MRVLVAPGRVGELSPPEVARIVATAWREAAPHVEIEALPQIDGGIGTASVLASVWAMKLAACCWTRRYSVVCSGRWRS